MRTFVIGLGISLAACGGAPYPPVRAAVDPAAHELYLLAFDAHSPRYLLLERTIGTAEDLALWLMDPEARTKVHRTLAAGTADALRTASLTPETAIAAVKDSELGRTLETEGFVWPKVVRTPTLETGVGVWSLVEDQLHVEDEGTDVPLVTLSPGESRADTAWLVALDGERMAVSLDYATTPAARDLRVLDPNRARALLLSTRAYEAHGRGEFETAVRLWFEALELAPLIPETPYNLACAQTRLGHTETALGYLARAIEVGGPRFRAMARVDVDLTALRPTPGFRELVDRLRPARD